MKHIEKLHRKKKWVELSMTILPVTIPVIFSFSESLKIAREIFDCSFEQEEQELALSLRDYSVNLMIALREKYVEDRDEWVENWMNEAMLGIMCGQTYRKKEAQRFLQNAIKLMEEEPVLLPKTPIKEVVSRRDMRTLVKHAVPSQVVHELTFAEAMQVAGMLTGEIENRGSKAGKANCDGTDAEFMESYGITMLMLLRENDPDLWDVDWKNEAFLGVLCSTSYREEEGFYHLQNAYNKHPDPPAELIVAFVNSGTMSRRFLSKEKVLELCQQAVDKELSHETASLMAFETGSEEWRIKTASLTNHTPQIVPDAVVE